MALIVPKDIILNSFKNVAEKGLMDRDFLVAKMQIMVTDGDLTQEEIQPVIDILYPQEVLSEV